MSGGNDLTQVVAFPDIDVTVERAGVGDVRRSESKAKYRLNLTDLSKHTLLRGKRVAGQGPEFYMLHATADDGVVLKRVELNIENL